MHVDMADKTQPRQFVTLTWGPPTAPQQLEDVSLSIWLCVVPTYVSGPHLKYILNQQLGP